MRPSPLDRNSFSAYPPQGRAIALAHLRALQQTPVPLLAVILRDLRDYDWKFPVEQQEIAKRVEFLQANPSAVASFARITLPPALEQRNCADQPMQVLAELTAYLWSSLQMDQYRLAAAEFVQSFNATLKPSPLAAPRLVVVLIGRDVQQAEPVALFQKLRPYGQVRTGVTTSGAAEAILGVLAKRSLQYPGEYAHWYLDGGSPLPFLAQPSVAKAGITQLVYPELAPINQHILERMTSCIQAGRGPEALQAELAQLSPRDLSSDRVTTDPRLQHFMVSLLTEGSGTQIFSTSFVQWAAREVLSRAQPLTLCVRFAPRQRQRPFNAMVRATSSAPQLDPAGSLIDAEMGAYYTYLELQRLPGADNAAFLVWFEGHPQVFVAGPGIAARMSSDSPVTMTELLSDLPYSLLVPTQTR